MTDLRQAAQQALEALELWCPAMGHALNKRAEAVVALRAALEKPEQPVAWMCPDDPQRETAFSRKAGHCEDCGNQRIPLFTAPPQRKPLSPEHILDISEAIESGDYWHLRFARAIEAAHGIKDA